MTKTLLSVALVACLLASTFGATVDASADSSGGLESLISLLNPLRSSISLNTLTDDLTQTLTTTANQLTANVGKTLQSAASDQLVSANKLVNTVKGQLSPTNLANAITSALSPQLTALLSLSLQLTGNSSECFFKSAKIITGATSAGTQDILKCANSTRNNVSKYTEEIGQLARGVDSFNNQALEYATNCIRQSVSSGNISGDISCLIQPVSKGVQEASNRLTEASSLFSKLLSATLESPTCVQEGLSKFITKGNTILRSIVKCASETGVEAKLRNLPSSISNFTAIVDKALSAIRSISSSTLGHNGPGNRLKDFVSTLKSVADKLTAQAINSTVAQSTKVFQAAIDQARKEVDVASNPEAASQCIENAQKSIDEIAPQVSGGISKCTVTLSKDIAAVVAQAVAFDIGLKSELAKASVNTFTNCSGYVLSLNNAAEKCFDVAVNELKDYVNSQITNVDKGFVTSQALVEQVEKCLSAGIQQSEKIGHSILNQLNACLIE